MAAEKVSGIRHTLGCWFLGVGLGGLGVQGFFLIGFGVSDLGFRAMIYPPDPICRYDVERTWQHDGT